MAFPVETIRHWYVTPYGGMSPELGLLELGIHHQALEENTALDPATDRVRITIVGRANPRPLLFDRFFRIVPLDEQHPDAFARSRHGEAVLPEGDDVIRRYEPPRIGDQVLINSVLTQRLGTVPSPDAIRKILEELLGASGPSSQDS